MVFCSYEVMIATQAIITTLGDMHPFIPPAVRRAVKPPRAEIGEVISNREK